MSISLTVSRSLVFAALLSGCAQFVVPLDAGADGAAPDAAAPDAAAPDAVTEASAVDAGQVASWPRRAILYASLTGEDPAQEALTLATGAVVHNAVGDLMLRYPLGHGELFTPEPDSLCVKGSFASLDEVPGATAPCVGGAWIGSVPMVNATTGDWQWDPGFSMLVRDVGHTGVYRFRLVDRSIGKGGARLVFDYEPVP